MCRFAAALTLLVSAGPVVASDWPMFRGPGSSGVGSEGRKLPAEIGPEQHVLWKTPLPPGHSSPVVVGDRIFLTAVRDKKLLTLGLDRSTGKVQWEAEAPLRQLEKIHTIGSHAQPTCAADSRHVVSVFGSSGILCYDHAGKQLWHLPMGPYKNEFGAGSSPMLVGDTVIVGQDHDTDSFLMALDVHTGEVRWRTDRSEFPVGYASPVLLEMGGRKQLVMAGTLRVAAYDLDTGREVWTVHGMARVLNMTPTVGPDGTVYVAGWAAGADPTDRFPVPPFGEMLEKFDANKNGTLEEDELPVGPIKQRFNLIDRDKDGHLTRAEYEGMRAIFQAAQNRMVAIRPGGQGDVTQSHVLWSQTKHLGFVPSPLLYKGQLFLLKNGGILTTLDAKSGKVVKSDRLPGASGDYYSSPVGGDGKVYLCSERGHVAVVSAEGPWQPLATARFDEDIYATPAIVDGRIYMRTKGHLYCFGLQR